MTSLTFFLIFIPILAIILLMVNFLLAPHIPNKNKDSQFECGFTSFVQMSRMPFSISFFIYALLFLLFDLEILLVYPYVVSSYYNDIFGLFIILIFLGALTIGFVYELGKKALQIDSKQTLISFKHNSFISLSFQSRFSLRLNTLRFLFFIRTINPMEIISIINLVSFFLLGIGVCINICTSLPVIYCSSDPMDIDNLLNPISNNGNDNASTGQGAGAGAGVSASTSNSQPNINSNTNTNTNTNTNINNNSLMQWITYYVNQQRTGDCLHESGFVPLPNDAVDNEGRPIPVPCEFGARNGHLAGDGTNNTSPRHCITCQSIICKYCSVSR